MPWCPDLVSDSPPAVEWAQFGLAGDAGGRVRLRSPGPADLDSPLGRWSPREWKPGRDVPLC